MPSGGSGETPEPTVIVWMGEGILGKHVGGKIVAQTLFCAKFCLFFSLYSNLTLLTL